MTSEMRRLPGRYLALAWLDNVPAVLGLTVALFISGQRQSTPIWLTAALWALLALRFVAPMFTWLTLHYKVDETGVSTHSGFVRRRQRHMAWPTVSAVQVDRPWAYRLGGLSRVVITQAGSEGTRIALPGVDVDVSERIAGKGLSGPHEQSLDTTIYHSSPKDLLIVSALYGQVAVLGAAATMAVVEALQTAGWADSATELVLANPVTLGLSVALLALTVGALATLLRYWRFTVTSSQDSVRLRYGLLATRDRRISQEKIVGLQFRRNIIEAALGRVRLSLQSLDSSSGLGSNLVLPSLRDDVVEQILADSFDHLTDLRWRLAARGRLVAALGASILFTALAAASPLLLDLNPAITIGLGFIAACLTAWAGRTLTARIAHDPDRETVVGSTQWLTARHTIVSARCVHAMTRISAFDRVDLVNVSFYAGAPVKITAISPNPATARSLQGLLSDATCIKQGAM